MMKISSALPNITIMPPLPMSTRHRRRSMKRAQAQTSGQRQSAYGNVAAAAAQRDAAQAQLDQLKAGSREEQITVAEASRCPGGVGCGRGSLGGCTGRNGRDPG